MTELNKDAAAVLALMAAADQPPLEALEPADARKALNEAIGAMKGEPMAVAKVEDLSADGASGPIPLRSYRPPVPASDELPLIVYFHGGGFVLGNLDDYDNLCRRLCVAARSIVVSVDYRLAPEHPFPAAVDDSVAATRWVTQNRDKVGNPSGPLCLAGDSAGANLATVVAHLLREDPAVTVSHQLLFYPVTDLANESPGYERRGQDYFLTTSLMRYFRGHYLRDQDDPCDERVSPLHAQDLSGMPPCTLLVCGFDPLLEEGLAYAEALRGAGVPVDLHEVEDQIHGFLFMDGAVAQANALLDTLGQRVGAALRESGS